MDRREVIRLLVLNEISDDFENVDQIILPHVVKATAKCGLAVGRAEIVDALAGLVRDGLAKAYILSSAKRDPFSGELPDMPPLDVIEENFETYFYITKEGLDFHRSDDIWRFLDDEGNLRPDWPLEASPPC